MMRISKNKHIYFLEKSGSATCAKGADNASIAKIYVMLCCLVKNQK